MFLLLILLPLVLCPHTLIITLTNFLCPEAYSAEAKEPRDAGTGPF